MDNNPQTTQHQTKIFYDKIYKWLFIIPMILLVFSIVYLVQFNAKNGDVIYKDVSLTGGTTITIFDGNVNTNDLKIVLQKEFPDVVVQTISDISTGKQHGFFVETKEEAEKIKASLEKYLNYKLTQDNSSIEFSGSALSSGFYQQLRLAIILAFIFMATVVFIIFRTPVPAGAVILSAFADIVMAVAATDMLGITLSTAGIIAFLMLIGYSVDTDILLTTRVLKKREGTINRRILDAFKTGMTMTLTAIAAVTVSLIIIYSFSDTLRQIFTILLIGLIFDIFNTWFTNASMLKWYAEAKGIQ